MLTRLRVYCLLMVAFAAGSALLGYASCFAVPYAAAEGLENAIRGAQTPHEVRSRIVAYYLSTVSNRVVGLVVPGIAGVITAAIALWELRPKPTK